MLELNDEECNKIALGIGISALAVARAMVRAGYAAGYRAAQVVPLPVQDDTGANGEPVYRPKAQAAMPPREPTQAMIDAGEKRRREIAGRGLCIGTIWRAMYDAWAQEQTGGSSNADRNEGGSTRAGAGPAATAAHVEPVTRVPPDHQPPCIERGCPNPSLMPTSEYCAYHARREPQAATDGPAADPIADLCESLRYIGMFEDDRRDGISPMCRKAADALERLARENHNLRADLEREQVRLAACGVAAMQNTRNSAKDRMLSTAWAWSASYSDVCRAVDNEMNERERAERAEAERDALRECVRAADAMADAYYPDPFHHAPPLTVDAYNAARAKVNTTEGEK